MGFALLIHALAATVWVGGMFFALLVLRPATAALEPGARAKLWADVLGRFFRWIWTAVAVLLVTGFWMVLSVPGGFGGVGKHVHLMLGLGVVMTMLAAHVFFAPLKRLRAAVGSSQWETAGRNLGQIRLLIAVNLTLGLVVIAVATAGRYLFR